MTAALASRSLGTYSPIDAPPPEQLTHFILEGRRRAGLLGLDFDAGSWEVSELLGPIHGRPDAQSKNWLYFTVRSDAGEAGPPLPDSVIGFVKATVAHMLGRVQLGSMRRRIEVGRLVAEALSRRGLESVCACTVGVFNDVIRLTADGPDFRKRPSFRSEVAAVAHLLAAAGIGSPQLSGWRPARENSGRQAATAGPASGADERKLPSPEFLDGLSEAFALARDDVDVFVSGICAILLSLPGRVSEALGIEEDCLFEPGCVDADRVCIRWPGRKGAQPAARWILSSMTPVTREAVARLHDVSAEPRRMKRWYDRNPATLYLPPHLEHLRTARILSLDDAGTLLGLAPQSLACACSRRGFSYVSVKGGRRGLAFREVEADILSVLRRQMVQAGGPEYHPLMLARWRAFQSSGGGSPCMFQTVNRSVVFQSLSPGPESRTTLFERVGIDPERRIRGRSHQLRHYLITLALQGGASVEDVLAWAGKGCERSLGTYDHVPDSDSWPILDGAVSSMLRGGDWHAP